jgi:hypothetical protein
MGGVQPLRQREAAVRMSSRPSCLVGPSFYRSGSTETNTWVQEAPVPRDLVSQEARRACSEWLQLQRLKRRVGVSYPGSKKHRTEASIRVPRMFNHTHSNNMINR